MECVDQLQHIRDTAGNIPQAELQQHNAPVRLVILQVADPGQLAVCLCQLLPASLRVDKQRVGVHRFIIADSGNIDPQIRKASAGL